MKLVKGKAGGRYTIVSNEYNGRARARLDSLGLVEGEEVYILSSSFAGIILIVKGSRLAVCHAIAKHVEVK